MFTKLFSALLQIRKIVAIVVQFIEVVGGVLDAARNQGYKFPGQTANA